jgi:dihydropteroate synthase
VQLWGVLNVTPDSFSDGGRWIALEDAIAHAERMRSEGADVIDVGGASSRPPGRTYGAGAAPVGEDEESARVVPVVRELAARGMRVSVDTTRAGVARRAIEAGASIVNDVSMGASDALLEVAAAGGAEVALMHTRGGGRVDAGTTAYRDVAAEVIAELERAVERAVQHGVPAAAIWIDPGIGFAKTAAQSAAVIGATEKLAAAAARWGARGVLVGASRKSFVAALAPRADGTEVPPGERLAGSLAALAIAALGGARAVRVHDVAESRQAVLVALAARDGGRQTERRAQRGEHPRA